MPLPDQNKQSNESLTEKIEELDSLINNKQDVEEIPVLNEMATDSQVDDADIPILDEVVSDSSTTGSDNVQQHVDIHGTKSEDLLELIDNIEHRLTNELESMVKTMKNTMKESIIDELKNRKEDASQGHGMHPDNLGHQDEDSKH